MGSCRVLVAEDDAGLREILQEGLAEEGFEVVAAEDGGRAWDLARDGGYDVLLLDEEMPVMTGRQLLRRLRDCGHATPALIISGNLHMDDDEQRTLGVGAVLRKPVSIAVLGSALRAACRIDDDGAASSTGGEA